MTASRLGYEQLSPAEQKVYQQLEKAFAACLPSVSVRGTDPGIDVMKVLYAVLGDNPHIIYFDRTQIRISSSLFGGMQLHLIQACSPAQNEMMQRELQTAVHRAAEDIRLLNPISDYDKLMCIYEYLQDHVVYDEQELETCRKYGTSMNPSAHNAYGALVRGRAVCDGITCAFSLIAQQFGYPAMLVGGRAAFRTENLVDHAWNVIRVGTKHYHLDPTWDITQKCCTGDYSYDYFCVGDDDMNTDHDWDVRTTPPCTGQELSFYFKNQCFANSFSQLEEIFRRYARSKQSVVRVKLSQGIPIPEPAHDHLGQVLMDAAASAGRFASIQYALNKGPMCFYARFTE